MVDEARTNPPGEPVYTPPRATHDPDEATLVISRADGTGEREVSVADWTRKYCHGDKPWVIKFSNYTGAHHSDNY